MLFKIGKNVAIRKLQLVFNVIIPKLTVFNAENSYQSSSSVNPKVCTLDLPRNALFSDIKGILNWRRAFSNLPREFKAARRYRSFP